MAMLYYNVVLISAYHQFYFTLNPQISTFHIALMNLKLLLRILHLISLGFDMHICVGVNLFHNQSTFVCTVADSLLLN